MEQVVLANVGNWGSSKPFPSLRPLGSLVAGPAANTTNLLRLCSCYFISVKSEGGSGRGLNRGWALERVRLGPIFAGDVAGKVQAGGVRPARTHPRQGPGACNAGDAKFK